jgi:hypothetical protein
MRGLRPVNAAWKVPTILTDASLQIELVRHLWPDMKLAGDIAVEARHQHIRQIIDRSYGLSSLDANDSTIADPGTEVHEKIRRTRKAERARRRRALCDVHARLHREARLAAPGILLAVAQKRIVAQIEAIGPLPRNVEWLHHGAVSGIDSFREVSRIVVGGRQAPSPAAVEACAEALTGAACTGSGVCLGLGELVAVAIEMDELPACDLPGAVRGDGDQGVAAGVIADRAG